MLANSEKQTLRLTGVYCASGVRHNLISYGILDKKGYTLGFAQGKRVVKYKSTNRVDFDVAMVGTFLWFPVRSKGPRRI